MEMTNNDCMVMLNALKKCKQPAFAEIKDMEDKDDYIFHVNFVKAVSSNKRKLEPIVESLQEADAFTDEYKKYVEERNELLAKHAKKDIDGSPMENIDTFNGVQRRAYYVPTAGVPGSACYKELKKLENDYKDAIDAREKQTKQLTQMLKAVVDFTPETVLESMVPSGLNPDVMDGIIFMVKWGDNTEPSEEKKSTKKK